MLYFYSYCGDLMGLSWCGYVLSANQRIFMRGNLCVGDCMYYIGVTVSHGAAFFCMEYGCMGLICFCRPIAAD